jgi:hypothetical protein
MTPPSSQAVLAGAALVILGGLAGAMLFVPIPAGNAGPMNFVLGALAGALTVSGGRTIVSALATNAAPGDAPAIPPPAPS